MQTQTRDLDEMLLLFGPEDPQVIELMVEQFEQYIYRLACAILNDPDEAADVSQETFIRASRKLNQYRPGTNIKAWLYTIAVNTARGSLRKIKTRHKLQSVLETTIHSPQTNSLESNSVNDDQKTELWEAVDQLGEKQRIVIILRIIEELSIKEIAQVLKIKEKTAYSRLYDGFRNLKLHLKKRPFPARIIGE